MKRLLVLSVLAVVIGLGSASTSKADHRYGGFYGGRYYSSSYYRGGYYGYRPGISISIGRPYVYSGYRGYYGTGYYGGSGLYVGYNRGYYAPVRSYYNPVYVGSRYYGGCRY